MKTIPTLNIAVAESSIITRSGLVSVLKKLSDIKVSTTEITSMEGLQHCMNGNFLDIIFINPAFEGWFNLKEFKSQHPNSSVKFVSILCAMTDMNTLKDYDDYITLYDETETISMKILRLIHTNEDNSENSEDEIEQETLSDREKEIICCVVKGMTNKEIAEQLYISIHTVTTHRRNITKKLQIHSSAGLTIYAIVNKLVKLEDVKL